MSTVSKVSNNIVYAGPTLAPLTNPEIIHQRGFEIFPPVQRGDILSLCQNRLPGIMVIVDGFFEHTLAISHIEIREAISLGWNVWGLSSIGAIRAYEMRELGLKGFGTVFDLFCQENDFQDDEVALLHEPIPPYRMFSEPLVHIRAAVAELQNYSFLTSDAGNQLISSLKQMWFGGRTLKVFEEELEKIVGYAKLSEIRSIIYPFDRFRIKTADLEKFMKIAPYITKYSQNT